MKEGVGKNGEIPFARGGGCRGGGGWGRGGGGGGWRDGGKERETKGGRG